MNMNVLIIEDEYNQADMVGDFFMKTEMWFGSVPMEMRAIRQRYPLVLMQSFWT